MMQKIMHYMDFEISLVNKNIYTVCLSNNDVFKNGNEINQFWYQFKNSTLHPHF